MMSDTTEMVAGRELDALVAERVMGWTGIERHIRGGIAMPPWPSGLDPVTSAYRTIPRYSTSIADAWLVVERMREKGYSLTLMAPFGDFGAVAAFVPRTGQRFDGDGDTPAVAISRAALSAMEAHR